MSVTFCVLKCDKSKEVKPQQWENIEPMLVTFWVLKCDKSREGKYLQPANIPFISVTFCVLRYSNPSICLSSSQL